MCAHDERLYNVKLKTKKANNIINLFDFSENTEHNKLVIVILFLKILLNKKDFKNFYLELTKLIEKYKDNFDASVFSSILECMGLRVDELKKLK